MQSNMTLADPTKMGSLNILPPELVLKVLENMSVGDVINMMSLNNYGYKTITSMRHTIFPTLFNTVKLPQITEDPDNWHHRNTWQGWIFNQPEAFQGEDTFKLLHNVAKKLRPRNFGEILNATKAGENQRCWECGTQVRWIDVRSGKPRCEKCTVWGLSPLLDADYGIIWSLAEGKVCILINLAADKQCQEKKEQGLENTETPFLK